MPRIKRSLLTAPLTIMMAGSAALIAAALYFQYGLNYAPCTLCHYQRWPYYALIGLGGLALFLGAVRNKLILAGATLLTATDAAIALFHTGVERKWWDGPAGCSGFSLAGGDVDELLNKLSAAPIVSCDDISWSFLGLSMANWNMVFALALTLFGVMSLRRMSR